MKKNLLILLISLQMMLTGCFSIIDEIFLDEKGSGKYQTTVDASKMMEMMEMFRTMMPDSVKDGNPEIKDLNLKDSISNMWRGLEKMPGITDVRRESDDKGVFSISFRFSDVNALNRALASRRQSDSSSVADTSVAYTFQKGRFICNSPQMNGFGDAFKGLNEGMSGSDSSGMNMDMLKGMMGEMKYTTIYHLPGKILDHTNKFAKVGTDGKTITLELDLMETEKGRSLHNDIKFK